MFDFTARLLASLMSLSTLFSGAGTPAAALPAHVQSQPTAVVQPVDLSRASYCPVNQPQPQSQLQQQAASRLTHLSTSARHRRSTTPKAPRTWAPAPTPVMQPAPQPVTQAPEPVTQAPQPVTQAPEPVTQAPQPVTQAPQPVTPVATPVAQGLTAEESRMVDLVNAERARAGLPALQVDPALVQTARAKSQDMATLGYFDHQSPTLGSPFDQMRAAGISYMTAGENIAGNQSVEAAHQALMNSAGHRANILNRSFTKVGIGIIHGGRYGMMFTQQFIG